MDHEDPADASAIDAVDSGLIEGGAGERGIASSVALWC